MKARSRTVVDVGEFSHPERPDRPLYPVQLAECYCEAQDGFCCPKCRRPPRYEYEIRTGRQRVWIRVGEWYVLWADGTIETYPSREAVDGRYELLADTAR